MVAPEAPEKQRDVDNGVVSESAELPKVTAQPNMNVDQARPIKSNRPLDHGEDVDRKPTLDPQDSPERKKLKSVGFCEVDISTTLLQNGASEDQSCDRSLDSGSLNNDKDIAMDLPESKDQSSPITTGLPLQCRKHSVPTCLCKECVENYLNLNESVEEPHVEEGGEDGGDLLCADSLSLDSNLVKSRSGSERSRSLVLLEEDDYGPRYEDAQVTLPYPDYSKPPDHITRLSNAGLFEPCEDQAEKREAEDLTGEEDCESQKVIPAFFIQHERQESFSGSSHKKVQLEMCEHLDSDKREAEVEPLLRSHRSRSVDVESMQGGPQICQCDRNYLKVVGSFLLSLFVFPAFLCLSYTFLPFDAPLMPDITTRLVYTLRCAAFASFPTILGVIIHGISRLCASSFDPFKPKVREVTIHQRFVKQSTFLFVLYFFNLCVLVTYMPQNYLKLIPLLTCLFALSQLIYWLSFAVGRSFRGFGYGLAFLPLVSMLACNLCFMFLVDPERMIYLGLPRKEDSKSKADALG
ncbi:transmembrane protein 79 [Xenopus laevis]|uniref:Transmembrane protein 79 n=2 Tax=Xenopus laevis TaxID=8355 RepID=A0A1L8F4V5_XENLA|nr:transmembrane protein 79 [Xenopus laevis]XP_018089023.1 transmembrane protein 79 [Xenopus laevis]XP_018089024.1 transmembrane protein 79 [Xenopus laevis]XP_018089025.1 transmembrane protein 79 [Xenopus laevis]OCT66616.1 hypothetical protein XELAEV_18042870mg [Xenopus laevis]